MVVHSRNHFVLAKGNIMSKGKVRASPRNHFKRNTLLSYPPPQKIFLLRASLVFTRYMSGGLRREHAMKLSYLFLLALGGYL